MRTLTNSQVTINGPVTIDNRTYVTVAEGEYTVHIGAYLVHEGGSHSPIQ
jgi:hypothetical protein